MQLYAFDSNDDLVNARNAARQVDYECLECRGIVRLRGGPHRQRHFYHLEPTPFCRQHQKGPVHLQLQSYFLQRLPAGDCQLECRFPAIDRIADVAWHSRKIVFEIQCSPISAEEVLERNRDYEKAGWQVVWILHDQRYNQLRLSAAELALRSSPHYFTNMDSAGKGGIYDQFDLCDSGLRLKRLAPLSVDIVDRIDAELMEQDFPLRLLSERAASWPHIFAGDLMSCYVREEKKAYLEQAIALEMFYHPTSSLWSRLPFILWQWMVARPYQLCFRFILERICR